MSIALNLYRAGTTLCAGLIARHDQKRLASKGVPKRRARERLGYATQLRPRGQLVWINAVSVGETLSALRLIDALLDRGTHVLLTTTTATAADMAERRLPKGAIHQFAPLDTPRPVQRFFDHWEPNLAICIESDIWPRQIRAAHSRGTPLALVNARLSAGSLRNWGRIKGSARRILGLFDQVYAQTNATAQGLAPFVKPTTEIRVTGDLKSAAAPLPVNDHELQNLRDAIGERPVWAALSTHDGEEAIVAQVFLSLLNEHPDQLMILAPRHPERAADIYADLTQLGLNVAQRSQGTPIRPDTQVYLADTLGELGLWFSLAQTAFIGASLVDRGGHNPFEAVSFGTPVIAGPHRTNFETVYSQMETSGAAQLLPDSSATAFAKAVARGLTPASQQQMSTAMSRFPLTPPDVVRDVAAQLLSLNPDERSPK